MTDRPRLRVIGPAPSSLSQGHNLLSHYLSLSGWQVAGWNGTLWQRFVVRLLRLTGRYPGRSPAQLYHIFLTRWHAGNGLIHLVWGDQIIECIDQLGRCILTLHQPNENWSEARWEKVGKCAGVICMAERECAAIRRRHPHLPCTFIPHGVDTDFWRPLPLAPERQVCAVGRHLRNFEMLLRVARILLDRHQDLDFHWVVNPDFKLSADLQHLLPPERFHILQNLSAEELHHLYAESWLFCTPYSNVAGSNSIVEAMASGVPIFTTRVGGMASYAGDRIITLVEDNDDAALADAVSRCLGSPELRADLASRSREHAVKYFSWPVVVAAHETFYRQIGQLPGRADARSSVPGGHSPS